MSDPSQNPVLLFDGPCNLCQGSVKFVLPRDRKGIIRYASLQSSAARELLRRSSTNHGTGPGMGSELGSETSSGTEQSNGSETSSGTEQSSVILIDGKGIHRRSTAALRVLRHMGLPWSLLYAFIVVPAPLRDAVYDFIARNRYRWFGRSESCMVPAKSVEDRFLDANENLATTSESL